MLAKLAQQRKVPPSSEALPCCPWEMHNRELNQLDAALYQQALQLLDASSERWAEDGRLQQLPPLPPPAPGAVEAEREKDRQADEKLPFHIPKPVEGECDLRGGTAREIYLAHLVVESTATEPLMAWPGGEAGGSMRWPYSHTLFCQGALLCCHQ